MFARFFFSDIDQWFFFAYIGHTYFFLTSIKNFLVDFCWIIFLLVSVTLANVGEIITLPDVARKIALAVVGQKTSLSDIDKKKS